MKIFITLLGLFLMFSNLYGQIGNYRTINNGDWTNISVWQRYNGTIWENATSYPTSADAAIEISSGHNIWTTTPVTVDQLTVYGILDINSTFNLLNGDDFDLVIGNNGILNMLSTISWSTNSGFTWKIQNGGNYKHYTSADINNLLSSTRCTVENGSTVTLSGITSASTYGGLGGKTLSNLVIESPLTAVSVSSITWSPALIVNNKFTIGSNVTLSLASSSLHNFNCDIDLYGNFTANSFELKSGKSMNIYQNGSLGLNSSNTLTNNGTIINHSSNYPFNGGTIFINNIYQHNSNSATIPTLTWNSGSTLKITGITSGTAYIPNDCQNVIWDCPNQTSNVTFLYYATTNVRGDLTIVNTGTGSVCNATSNSQRDHIIWGSLNIQGGRYYITSNSCSVNQNLWISNDVNLSGGTFKISGSTVSGTATLNLDRNLIISSGTLNLSSSNTATGTINLKGNINHTSGTITEIGSAATKIKLYGSTAQTISSVGFDANSNIDIELSNSTGVSLLSDLSPIGSFTFTSGKFNLSNYNLSLGSASNINGNSTTMYFISNGVGSLTRKGVSSTLKEFPIGTSSYYSPVSVTNDASPDDFTASVVTDATGTNSGSNRVKLRWEIHGTRASYNNGLTLKLGWMLASEGTNFKNNRVAYAKMWHIEGSNWIEAGSGVYTLSTSSEPYTLSRSGINSLSPFATGQNEGALPITLSSFSHTIKDNNITLFWTTTSEINNSGFDVERKSNDNKWETVAFIKGKGNSNITESYTYNDINLNTGNYYYRLKQKDFNGNFTYFDLQNSVEIKPPNNFSLSQNYPNPFNSESIIRFSIPENTNVSIVLYDCLGKLIRTLSSGFYNAGYHSLKLNSNDLASGVYIYKITTSSQTISKKLMVIK